MSWTRTLTWVALVLSVIWYRSGDLIKNCILIRSPLPHGYIANGDFASDCKVLGGKANPHAQSMSYCEDETFWELHDEQGKLIERSVIASCDPGRKGWNTVMGPLKDPNPRGGLWLYVPSKEGSKEKSLASKVTPDTPHRIEFKNYPENHDFHPLGIAIWPSHRGEPSNLYVINHAREKTVIEQFTIDPATPTVAEHVRTISSVHTLSANGLALTSPDAFYVTNDHLITRRWPIVGHVLPVIESVLGLPLAFVAHITLKPTAHKGADAIAAASFVKLFIPFPNGVAVSSSGTEVALVSTSMSQIHVYERDPMTNALTQRKYSVTVPFSPDNIHFTEPLNGGSREEIVVAGHPNFPDLIAVAENKTGVTSSSWVVAIIPKDDKKEASAQYDLEAPVSLSSKVKTDGVGWTMKTLFQSDGVEEQGGFPGSTTGLVDPVTGNFYVSGLYAEGGVLVCKPRSAKVKN
ncbi:hypothetical protein CVT26_000246 [Gymnopilus dilepis]|uniref:SMP-30/Gluconolactonase/LRE-like region domain-containing protein n=1 Tax=Gymnopilus dilepis TaxID=231916 RepID=A0A409VGC8_9AGAR|nr:hypothetical protein CVT26_000246 [Gymnopilus dilepis]